MILVSVMVEALLAHALPGQFYMLNTALKMVPLAYKFMSKDPARSPWHLVSVFKRQR